MPVGISHPVSKCFNSVRAKGERRRQRDLHTSRALFRHKISSRMLSRFHQRRLWKIFEEFYILNNLLITYIISSLLLFIYKNDCYFYITRYRSISVFLRS